MNVSKLLCIALLFSISMAFYTAKGPVTILKESNFKDLVLNSQDVWMVEFFAPWCGHCKAMKDEWIKAANAMGGVVHFGAVDCTEEKGLAQKYGVQGFPTIKIFSPIKKGPMDYQQGRDSTSFVKSAFSSLKEVINGRLEGKLKVDPQPKASSTNTESKSTPPPPPPPPPQQEKASHADTEGKKGTTIELTTEVFQNTVIRSSHPWIILFSDPASDTHTTMMDLVAYVAGANPHTLKVAYVLADREPSLLEAFQLKEFPAIIALKGGDKLEPQALIYQDEFTFEKLNGFAGQLVGDYQQEMAKPLVISELTSPLQFDSTCGDTTCILLLVPHILDSKTELRNEYINLFTTIANGQARGLFNYGWLVGGSQYDIEQKLNIGFGYPAVIAISRNKKRYAIHSGSFTETNVNVFIRGLQSGRARTSPLPELPPFVSVDPWDGKDMVMEEEEMSE